MRVAVTGANGFIGKNLISRLNFMRNIIVTPITRDTSEANLNEILSKTEFVFHLAGANRPENEEDFQKINIEFTEKILQMLHNNPNKPSVLFSSSVLVQNETIYGQTKLRAEDLVYEYGRSSKTNIFVYRLSNVFGKWANPRYNSVVATFCHNISRDLPIEIHSSKTPLRLHFIDDVVDAFINCLDNNMSDIRIFETSLKELAEKIYGFSVFKDTIKLPKYENLFDKYLFSTYISYLPENKLTTVLKSNKTENSEFSELVKFNHQGQISLNVINSRSVRGNHWHHTKHEKFLVIQGNGVIRLRKLFSTEVIELYVDGRTLEWVEILPGYVHNIENVGDNPLLTIMWASEIYDSSKPDTFSEEV